MKTLITARHCEVPEDVRERAEMLIEKTARKVSRPQRAEVIFDDDHDRKIVELQLVVPRGRVHICTAEAQDLRTALDRAIDKLNNQLDKARQGPDRRAAVGEL